MNRRIPVIATVWLIMACSRSGSIPPTQADEVTVGTGSGLEATAAEAQERFDQLVQPHIGDQCTEDSACLSPLRCYEEVCATPTAISGERNGSTPMAIFYTAAGEVTYWLEVTDTQPERARGLMHRPIMLPDWGMLFIFPDERHLSFWMENTYIPLDMVFINSEAIVVGVVENAEPLTRTSRAVDGESTYVIELNGGDAARQGIVAGVHCELLNLN